MFGRLLIMPVYKIILQSVIGQSIISMISSVMTLLKGFK